MGLLLDNKSCKYGKDNGINSSTTYSESTLTASATGSFEGATITAGSSTTKWVLS